jgi:uncharacterized protein YeaO (DUF488 family)
MTRRRVRLKRVYDPPARADGKRILVERLWPRGLARERAKLAAWPKEIAPSPKLRKWFDHRPERWDEFRTRYFAELDAQREAVAELRELVARGVTTFVFASREEQLNNAVALREYLENTGSSPASP